MNERFWYYVMPLFLFGLNILDMISSHILLLSGGYETNPFMRVMLSSSYELAWVTKFMFGVIVVSSGIVAHKLILPRSTAKEKHLIHIIWGAGVLFQVAFYGVIVISNIALL